MPDLEPEPEPEDGVNWDAKQLQSGVLRYRHAYISCKWMEKWMVVNNTKIKMYKNDDSSTADGGGAEDGEVGTGSPGNKYRRAQVTMDLLEIDNVSRPRESGYFEIKIHGKPRWRLEAGSQPEAAEWTKVLWALTPVLKAWMHLKTEVNGPWSKQWFVLCRGRLMWFEEELRKKGVTGHLEIPLVADVISKTDVIFEIQMADGAFLCIYK